MTILLYIICGALILYWLGLYNFERETRKAKLGKLKEYDALKAKQSEIKDFLAYRNGGLFDRSIEFDKILFCVPKGMEFDDYRIYYLCHLSVPFARIHSCFKNNITGHTYFRLDMRNKLLTVNSFWLTEPRRLPQL